MPAGLQQHLSKVFAVFSARCTCQAALEFAAWAHTSPTQRAAALRMQALVAAELRSSARMAAICEWGAGQRLPSQAVQAAAASAGAAAGMGPNDETWGVAAFSGPSDGDAAAVAAAGGLQSHCAALRPAPGVRDWEQRQQATWEGTGSMLEEVWREQSIDGSLSSSKVGGLATGQHSSTATWQQAVEELLQANARLLRKLEV
jgi:hypothetical protein